MTETNGTATMDEPATLAAGLEQISRKVQNAKAVLPTGESDEQRRRRSEAFRDWCDVCAKAGRRYLPLIDGRPVGGVSLENFKADLKEQRDVASKLKEFCGDIETRVNRGEGLILMGPKGTGKDHLALSCLRAAAQIGFKTAIIDGQELFQQFREVIGNDWSEGEHVKRFTRPDVLLLSDPVPVSGATTDFQRSILWRIIDRRYRDLRPTWMTLNVADRKEAEERIGGQIVDRISDGATVLACKWESHRHSGGSK